jgi:hypothetical protein
MTTCRAAVAEICRVIESFCGKPTRRLCNVAVLLFCMSLSASVFSADEEPADSKAKDAAGQRLSIMRDAIDSFQVMSPQSYSEDPLTFADRPLLRYNDQSREAGRGIKGVLDATMWRLGEKGRPKAVVTLEIYLVENGSPLLTYEFVSLSPQKLDMKNANRVLWLPHTTQLVMEPLNVDTVPADTPRARLVQMRELARRFTAEEKLLEEKIGLRLLAQPVDRYDDKTAGIVDGTVFVFANGTNPEMGLLLECTDKQWSYGTFRLTSADLFAEFDGKSISVAEKPFGYPPDGPYTATRHPIFLPEEAR